MDTSGKNDRNMVTGLFYDRDSAESAYQAAIERGYEAKDLNLAMSDETRTRHFEEPGAPYTELGNKAAEGAGIGGATGGALGALITAAAAAGSALVLPGIGLVIAGPLAGAFAGAGAGAITGGLIGALVGWGIPEERVKRYESGLKEGGMLLGVRPRTEEDAVYLEEQWRRRKGQQVSR